MLFHVLSPHQQQLHFLQLPQLLTQLFFFICQLLLVADQGRKDYRPASPLILLNLYHLVVDLRRCTLHRCNLGNNT